MASLPYTVNKAFVEFAEPEDQDFLRGKRSRSDDCKVADSLGVDGTLTPPCSDKLQYMMPATPSPFLHAASHPQDAFMPPLFFLNGDEAGLPPSFGDFGTAVDGSSCMHMMDGQQVLVNGMGEVISMADVPNMTSMGMGDMSTMGLVYPQEMWDPNYTSYVQQGWAEPGYNEMCGQMMEGQVTEGQVFVHGEDGQLVKSCYMIGAFGTDGQLLVDMNGQHPSAKSRFTEDGSASCKKERGDSQAETESKLDVTRGTARERARPEVLPAEGVKPGESEPVMHTTVMLRNIPNKYTREMLVEQLSAKCQGDFDFLYLPIDFKNKCNVGYAFVNFRTPAICTEFVRRFHGVEVRRCLPGWKSTKIVEITPARVQGLDENVRRLKSSPVMNQLAEHPEWMPMLFDEYGEEKTFPKLDTPVPAKTRGRGQLSHSRS